MSIKNFIPAITAAAVNTAYSTAQIVIPTSTAKYDGEAKTGNAVKVVNAVTPTVQDYAAQGRRFTPEELKSTDVTILIDKEWIVPQRVDDIDRRQAAGSLDQFTDLQGVALAEKAEAYVISKLIAEGKSVNVVGSAPVTVNSPAKAKAAVLTLRNALTAAKVPTSERFLACNTAFAGLLIDALSDAAAAGSDGELRNGQIGRLYGMTVLESADFADDTNPIAVAYHAGTWAYVGQIDESRAVPASDGHADILSTLLVCGAKVTRPAGVAVFVSGGTPAP